MDNEYYKVFHLEPFVVEQQLGLPSGSVESVAVEYVPNNGGKIYLDIILPVEEYDELVKRGFAMKNAYKHRKRKR